MEIGGLGQQPDLKGRELDLFRRYLARTHLGQAGKEMPNFEKNPHDTTTL